MRSNSATYWERGEGIKQRGRGEVGSEWGGSCSRCFLHLVTGYSGANQSTLSTHLTDCPQAETGRDWQSDGDSEVEIEAIDWTITHERDKNLLG